MREMRNEKWMEKWKMKYEICWERILRLDDPMIAAICNEMICAFGSLKAIKCSGDLTNGLLPLLAICLRNGETKCRYAVLLRRVCVCVCCANGFWEITDANKSNSNTKNRWWIKNVPKSIAASMLSLMISGAVGIAACLEIWNVMIGAS